MSSVIASSYQLDREEAGETTLELIALRYTGSQTVWSAAMHLESAGYPSATPLDGGATADDNGQWEFVLMPDDGLHALEGRPDLEVVYADQREQFVELLLDQQTLPTNVFGRGADLDLQDRLFDALGLAPVAEAGSFEEQLREIAGREDEEPDDAVSKGAQADIIRRLNDEYTRSELGDIAKELREDASDFNLRENAGKTDRAEYIAGFDTDARAAAVDAALGGED